MSIDFCGTLGNSGGDFQDHDLGCMVGERHHVWWSQCAPLPERMSLRSFSEGQSRKSEGASVLARRDLRQPSSPLSPAFATEALHAWGGIFVGSCRTMCLGFAWIPDDLGIWRVFFIFYFFEEVVDGGSVLPILTISYHGKPDLTCSKNVKPMPGKHSGHASKNGAGQLVSPLRTIMFGQYFTDSSGARKWGLPPAVFRRSEPMSDAMNAALWNPYYVISSTATWLQSYEIFQNISDIVRICQIFS